MIEQGLTLAHAHGRHGAVEVFPHRATEFRLAAIGLDHAHVGRDTSKGVIEHLGAHTGVQRQSTELALPLAEGHCGLYFKVAVVRLRNSAGGRGQTFDDLRRGCGLERGGNGSGRLLGTGNQRKEAGGGDQLAKVPATGKAWGHSGVHRAKPEGTDLNMPALLVGRQSVT